MGFDLPDVFCWAKFGAESGERPRSIVERKDRERAMDGGIFLWGIGNSIRPSLTKLLELQHEPLVLFTPMKASPKREDSAPDNVVMWCGSVGMDGREFWLPPHSIVISRPPKAHRRHFALVCRQDASLIVADPGITINKVELRNLLSGAHVGSSQVTSVVRRTRIRTDLTSHYAVRFVAALAPPYMVELTDPVWLQSAVRPDLAEPEGLRSTIDALRDIRRNKQPKLSPSLFPA